MNNTKRTAAADLEVTVIPRPEHTLSRKDISKGALRVLYRLHEAGYRACLVGGAVRDLLIGRKPKDFDVATDATPEEVRKLFRNSRLIGRRFRLAHVLFGPEIVEVATFRGEGGGDDDARRSVDGRLVRDNVWGTIEEDARRRDFRVNALYYDIADFAILDFVGGMRDLEDGVLRMIGDPEQRYREDPVRMLRAARLSAKLGFAIDDAAREPIGRLSGLLDDAAPARLFDESLKLFMKGHAVQSFHVLEDLDLLRILYPGMVATFRHDQDGLLRSMVEQALINTDARVNDGRRVTPAFLLAVFLWGEVKHLATDLMARGSEPSLAWQRAGQRVISAQVRYVAIPRRFTAMMQEVWELQPHFFHRRRKRVFRLLHHQRFRAAYDFLLLRAGESDAVKQEGIWWTHAQEVAEDVLSAELDGNAGKTTAAKPKRRRRRRRRKSSGDRETASE